jgi:urease accessory protein
MTNRGIVIQFVVMNLLQGMPVSSLSLLSRRVPAFLLLALASTASQAHPGHGADGLLDGLAHPFGLDHLLAMVAVGVWSVVALPAKKIWWGPVTFMAALAGSAMLGASGIAVPYLEQMVALSVALLGVMLLLARQLPALPGLALVAVAASLHGLAHGAEAPSAAFGAYAAGFLLTTAVLHIAGALAFVGMQRHAATLSRFLGLAFGGAGLFLFSQV